MHSTSNYFLSILKRVIMMDPVPQNGTRKLQTHFLLYKPQQQNHILWSLFFEEQLTFTPYKTIKLHTILLLCNNYYFYGRKPDLPLIYLSAESVKWVTWVNEAFRFAEKWWTLIVKHHKALKMAACCSCRYTIMNSFLEFRPDIPEKSFFSASSSCESY